MKSAKKTLLTALFTSVVLSSQAQAANLSSKEQVDLAVSWFTGLFDNSKQVQNNPAVPFVTMENCAASTFNGIVDLDSQYVHLEQYRGGTSLLRSSAYEFSPISSGVSLQVYSYLNRDAAVGTCDEATPSINLGNLASPSCDLELTYTSETFFGTNDPVGCPANSFVFDTVVSTVEIMANGVDAKDEFLRSGATVFVADTEFRAIATTHEPLGAIPLIGLGIAGLIKHRR